ncbi:DUF1697 domain-containing protein [Ruania halotolerans]|uniref:DUF1697 domain-containing protein n=1 Tax=Ruania halotolerans TaxID=2897773 RepID=UPI001E37F75D|nr:DUF1697 domain-containing protein [Ruania halotolerans]UFU05338.1 DUF1697 domain-containing protein [Ruania halotolerans]
MTAYTVLLRGVNVQGTTMTMADLRATLQHAGFPGVRTVLASGNVLLEDDRPGAQVRELVEAALREQFGYDAWVQVIEHDELARIAEAYPFDTDESTHHPYVVFCRDSAALTMLVADLPQPGDDRERVAAGERVLYWETPKGHSLDTPVAKLLARKRFKADTTTRNLRTVRKLLT